MCISSGKLELVLQLLPDTLNIFMKLCMTFGRLYNAGKAIRILKFKKCSHFYWSNM